MANVDVLLGLRLGRDEGDVLASEVSQAQPSGWLLENGPRELESLFRAILPHAPAPALVTDDGRIYSDDGSVRDHALLLLDVNGRVAGWYSGAASIYGYNSDEANGKHVSFLYSTEENPSV